MDMKGLRHKEKKMSERRIPSEANNKRYLGHGIPPPQIKEISRHEICSKVKMKGTPDTTNLWKQKMAVIAKKGYPRKQRRFYSGLWKSSGSSEDN
jgi:hypothetical protein